jgi:DNA topoisomerase I
MTVKIESKCLLCVRKAIREKYCEYHYEAARSLRGHYEVWKNRYGEISWYDYLTRLQKIKHTGKWVKEVIEIELENIKKNDKKMR